MPRRRGFPGLHRLQGVADRAIPLHADFPPSVHTDSRAAATHGGEIGLRDRFQSRVPIPPAPRRVLQKQEFLDAVGKALRGMPSSKRCPRLTRKYPWIVHDGGTLRNLESDYWAGSRAIFRTL